jgi:antitoxin component of MazEF toxin-antitoxin module
MDIRKIFRNGNSWVVTLPPDAIRFFNLHEGSHVKIIIEPDSIVIMPVEMNEKSIDAKVKTATEEEK